MATGADLGSLYVTTKDGTVVLLLDGIAIRKEGWDHVWGREVVAPGAEWSDIASR